MRQPRLKAPSHHPVGHYHCVSRVVHRMMLFGEAEKDKFVSLMREYAQFCGVRIVAYCVMTNHFHIAVEVPKPPEELVGHEWLLERLSGLTVRPSVANSARQKIRKFLDEGAEELVQEWVNRCKALMWDISQFMKLLKQRFTVYFNKRHGLSGTLWESRFHSTLIGGAGNALAAVAAYIELNPVRAELVVDPANYKWCSLADACRGDKAAIDGIRIVVAGAQRMDVELVAAEEAIKAYRGLLIGKSAMDRKDSDTSASSMETPSSNQAENGSERNPNGAPDFASSVPLGPTKAEILERVLGNREVSLAEYIQIRVRCFTDGAVLGSKEYVEEIFQEFHKRYWPKRSAGASRVQGLDEKENIFSFRKLRKRPFG